MTQQATAREVSEAAAYVHSHLSDIEMYHFGNEPQVQIDFHIPCEQEQSLVYDTLAALVPSLSDKHTITAFQAGDYIQLSLHKEPSVELGQAFFHEALGRLLEDREAAEAVAEQIARNRKAEIERVRARMKRLEKLKKKRAETEAAAGEAKEAS